MRKLSFASQELTTAASGMTIGGVTPFGLPPEIRILVDAAVMDRPEIVLGGGHRSAKIRTRPTSLLAIPAVEVIERLAVPG